MTTQGPKRQKLRGIIRLELRRIEYLMKTGYTIEGIAKMLSDEMDIPINARSLRNGISLVRKEYRERAETHIAQYDYAPASSPAPSPQSEPDLANSSGGLTTTQHDEPPTVKSEPWKPKKARINPLKVIEEMRKKGEI